MNHLLRNLENLGYVRSVKHNTLPLIVWNYTPACQFEKKWADYPLLRQCRGLVTDLEGNVKLRCYEKFFNYSEHSASELPLGAKNLLIEQKLDGSLLIVGKVFGEVVYSTRGSFYSDQAIAGAELFKKLYSEDWLVEGVTYLFEYVGPSNRIVVNYSEDNLILHGAIYTDSGLDFEVKEPFEKVKSYEMQGAIFGDLLYNHLLNLNISNEEGFVIKVKEPGLPTWMCKTKFSTYCLLHKIVTGVSNKTVWEYLRDGKSFEDIIEIVPDEFNEWLKATKASLELGYLGLESRAKYAYGCVKGLDSRKDQAIELMNNHKELSGIVFKMIDGSDYSGSIWNMIKPDRFVQPFSNKGEE